MSLLLFFAGSVAPAGRRGGSSISGGTFSRGRWRKLKDAEEAARLQALADREAKNQAQRIEARRLLAEARAKILAERKAQQAQWAEQARLRQIADAQASQRGAQGVIEVMHRAALDAAAAHAWHQRAMADDEDEAIALLMLHE